VIRAATAAPPPRFSYRTGAIDLMGTAGLARDDGPEIVQFPPGHPCRTRARDVADYEARFVPLRPVRVLTDGTRVTVDDVPQRVRSTAWVSAGLTAPFGDISRVGSGTPARRRPGRSPAGEPTVTALLY
jgi:hypothetical protein